MNSPFPLQQFLCEFYLYSSIEALHRFIWLRSTHQFQICCFRGKNGSTNCLERALVTYISVYRAANWASEVLGRMPANRSRTPLRQQSTTNFRINDYPHKRSYWEFINQSIDLTDADCQLQIVIVNFASTVSVNEDYSSVTSNFVFCLYLNWWVKLDIARTFENYSTKF